jgi:secreted PhoX family phosphatase
MRRRTILSLGASAAASAAGLGFLHVFRGTAEVETAHAQSPTPTAKQATRDTRPNYGLVPDRAGVLDLPPGYSYQIIGRVGEPLGDGYRCPGKPDAMACFDDGKGAWVLMRNHEEHTDPSGGALAPGQSAPSESFDARYHGGVSRIVLDPKTLSVKSSNLALTGTARNCAGGTSPWGWLTCEESLDPGHGYVFLCDPAAATLRPPKRIPAYGRFNHEAATVDPKTLIAYLTEDQADSCFYRFVPKSPAKPFEGQLQALKIAGVMRADLGPYDRVGEALSVEWVNVEDAEAKSAPTKVQAQRRGAAIVRRGEGLWLRDGQVYLSATIGGPKGAGQIFRLSANEDKLHLVAVSRDPVELNMPDNLCLGPDGSVYAAEDNLSGVQHVRRITPDGKVSTFARNRLSAFELAGVCFSPDGSAMFLNLQDDGLTLAVRGPFVA